MIGKTHLKLDSRHGFLFGDVSLVRTLRLPYREVPLQCASLVHALNKGRCLERPFRPADAIRLPADPKNPAPSCPFHGFEAGTHTPSK